VYPKAAVVDGPDRVVIRIPYSAEPSRLNVTAYRKVKKEHGWHQTVGRGEKLAYDLKPQREKGHIVAWDAVLQLEEEDRHFYLDVFARLRQGGVSYALHART
jgi:hypothetical protein